MEIIVLSLLLLSLAFSLGFALNRGSTCAVIAITELIQERKPARFVAFFECTLWGALTYSVWQLMPQAHWSGLVYAATGGVIFGIGAFVNGACAFGSVGHLGNGDTQFGFTFLGIYAVSIVASLANLLPAVATSSMSLQVAAPVSLSMLIGFAVLRFVIQRNNVTAFLKMTCAMLAIGVAYATIVLLKPGWSIALSHAQSLPLASIAITAAMFAGSIGSRWSERGENSIKWPSLRGALRRLVGGTLMGSGAVLIPGGNDTLLLVGLPIGAQEAALAYLLFAISVAVLVRTIGSPAQAWS
ncbi:YeeE/YedE family protein (plasmid) [Aminobacter sp. SR38]|uniref:YeeE/YedE thiosulfate transporter family protein n=1 Tax=Aminobacter TaxID=31988 RepID=UPI00177E4F4F|nr:YeeE/YedE thiosulfate transporter family protein [Aminobacter sp. SR38]QOF74556.1 YeeE/YedE family protein [Aminobacter sp. SR38]